MDGFHENVAVNRETASADLIHGVLRGVVVAVVRPVIEVNDVYRGNAAFYKRKMVIFDGLIGLKKVALVPILLSSLSYQIHEPARGVTLALDVQVLVPDHVREHERLDLAQRSVATPLRREMAAAVGRVRC